MPNFAAADGTSAMVYDRASSNDWLTAFEYWLKELHPASIADMALIIAAGQLALIMLMQIVAERESGEWYAVAISSVMGPAADKLPARQNRRLSSARIFARDCLFS